MPVNRPWQPFAELTTRVLVKVDRERRDRCANCQQRRVLYRIGLLSNSNVAQTEARCRQCWGMLENARVRPSHDPA